jgi:hypothetical protein
VDVNSVLQCRAVVSGRSTVATAPAVQRSIRGNHVPNEVNRRVAQSRAGMPPAWGARGRH